MGKQNTKEAIKQLRKNGKRLPDGSLYIDQGVKLLNYRTISDDRPRNKTHIPLVLN